MWVDSDQSVQLMVTGLGWGSRKGDRASQSLVLPLFPWAQSFNLLTGCHLLMPERWRTMLCILWLCSHSGNCFFQDRADNKMHGSQVRMDGFGQTYTPRGPLIGQPPRPSQHGKPLPIPHSSQCKDSDLCFDWSFSSVPFLLTPCKQGHTAQSLQHHELGIPVCEEVSRLG